MCKIQNLNFTIYFLNLSSEQSPYQPLSYPSKTPFSVGELWRREEEKETFIAPFFFLALSLNRSPISLHCFCAMNIIIWAWSRRRLNWITCLPASQGTRTSWKSPLLSWSWTIFSMKIQSATIELLIEILDTESAQSFPLLIFQTTINNIYTNQNQVVT